MSLYERSETDRCHSIIHRTCNSQGIWFTCSLINKPLLHALWIWIMQQVCITHYNCLTVPERSCANQMQLVINLQIHWIIDCSPLNLMNWHWVSGTLVAGLLTGNGTWSLADLNDPEALSDGGWMHRTSSFILYEVTEGAPRVLSS